MSSKSIWIVGLHSVNAVLQLNPQRALALYAVINPRNSAQSELLDLARNLGVSLHPVDKAQLTRLCGNEQHQGIGLQAKAKHDGGDTELQAMVTRLLDDNSSPPLLLILDQVQDPHNFGACLRSADAAGVDAVIVAKDNAAPMTSVVQKVACGAAESMPIFRVTNLARCLDAIKQQGVWLVGTSDKAQETLYDIDLRGPTGLVMGAEGRGLRTLTEKKCDALVNLPMAGQVVSSLNVSVATGVCLYEAVRQRRH